MMPLLSEQNRPCVLVVEQNAVGRELLQRSLHLAGFETLGASTGERALLLLREHGRKIGWLVTSRTLPGLVDRGILADEFHSYHPSRIVLVSAELAPSDHAGTPVGGLDSGEIVTQIKASRDAEGAPDYRHHALAA
jgi:CheY-like chemotaxis protein